MFIPLRPRRPLLFRSAGKGGKRGRSARPAAALRCSCISFKCSASHPKNSLPHGSSDILGVCLPAGRQASPLTSPPELCGACLRWPIERLCFRTRLQAPGETSRSLQVVLTRKRNDRPRRHQMPPLTGPRECAEPAAAGLWKGFSHSERRKGSRGFSRDQRFLSLAFYGSCLPASTSGVSCPKSDV